MKTKTYIKSIILTFVTVLSASYANAGAGHDHSDHGHEHAAQPKAGGPNGGRMITSVSPHMEFLLTADRFVQITFIDQAGKVVPVGEQQVSLIGGDRSAPVKIKFVESGGTLRSSEALPEIKNMPVVLQIKVTATAKIIRERFYLNMSNCSSCSFKEYACTCGH